VGRGSRQGGDRLQRGYATYTKRLTPVEVAFMKFSAADRESSTRSRMRRHRDTRQRLAYAIHVSHGGRSRFTWNRSQDFRASVSSRGDSIRELRMDARSKPSMIPLARPVLVRRRNVLYVGYSDPDGCLMAPRPWSLRVNWRTILDANMYASSIPGRPRSC